jgi:UDP-2,3-diacylglucosamine hydrolase
MQSAFILDLEIKLANQKVPFFARINYLQPKIHHELIVFSDVHLKTEHDERGALLLKLLSDVDTNQTRHLVLLGDIFDFCFGASPYFHKKFRRYGQELSRLSREGVKIYFIEGNHEFMMNELPWDGVKFIKKGDLQITLHDGTKVSFTHGDTLQAPWHYRLYSQTVRSKLAKLCASQIPQRYLDKLALAISAKSRDISYSHKIDHKKILAKIRSWIITQSSDVGIVGHFHIPYDIKYPKQHCRIFGLDSWDKPNSLSYNEGVFYRTYFETDGYKTVSLDH